MAKVNSSLGGWGGEVEKGVRLDGGTEKRDEGAIIIQIGIYIIDADVMHVNCESGILEDPGVSPWG